MERLEGETDGTAWLLTTLTGCALDHTEVKGRKITLMVGGAVL